MYSDWSHSLHPVARPVSMSSSGAHLMPAKWTTSKIYMYYTVQVHVVDWCLSLTGLKWSRSVRIV